jgi:hypothetical protein
VREGWGERSERTGEKRAHGSEASARERSERTGAKRAQKKQLWRLALASIVGAPRSRRLLAPRARFGWSSLAHAPRWH